MPVIINKLSLIDLLLQVAEEVASLKQIVTIVTDSDMSPFEIIHSGLVGALLSHLTIAEVAVRNDRLCRFLQAFLNLPVS
jgi:hypothetical protein